MTRLDIKVSSKEAKGRLQQKYGQPDNVLFVEDKDDGLLCQPQKMPGHTCWEIPPSLPHFDSRSA